MEEGTCLDFIVIRGYGSETIERHRAMYPVRSCCRWSWGSITISILQYSSKYNSHLKLKDLLIAAAVTMVYTNMRHQPSIGYFTVGGGDLEYHVFW